MGRQAKVPGVRRDKVSSSSRGFRSISVTEATKAKFLVHCAGRKPDDALLELLAPADGQWERIKDALLDEFGFANRDRVDRALRSAGMP